MKIAALSIMLMGGLFLAPCKAQTLPEQQQHSSGGAQAVSTSPYSIKPSDVRLPEGVAYGQYRRIVQPFENWVLNCDENLKSKQRVCNISQIIVDAQGGTVFSWSMAATKDGTPLMILRVPSNVGPKGEVRLSFPDRKEPVVVKTSQCDSSVCLGLVPVGPIFRENIRRVSVVGVSFDREGMGTVTFDAPLKGLAEALDGIG